MRLSVSSTFYITTRYYVNAARAPWARLPTIVAGMRRLYAAGGCVISDDRHGRARRQKSSKAAKRPDELKFVDSIGGQFRALWPKLSKSKHDQFILDPRAGVPQKVADNGDIYFVRRALRRDVSTHRKELETAWRST